MKKITTAIIALISLSTFAYAGAFSAKIEFNGVGTPPSIIRINSSIVEQNNLNCSSEVEAGSFHCIAYVNFTSFLNEVKFSVVGDIATYSLEVNSIQLTSDNNCEILSKSLFKGKSRKNIYIYESVDMSGCF